MGRLDRLGVALVVALGLVVTVGVVGCEKDPPKVAEPSELPINDAPGEVPGVVVEEPGAQLEPGDSPPPTEPDGSGRTEIVSTDIACESDADCVKDSCCHARACVAATDAPSCADTMCTADCRAGTMDCNGGCLCHDGKCAAKLWWPPEPSSDSEVPQ